MHPPLTPGSTSVTTNTLYLLASSENIRVQVPSHAVSHTRLVCDTDGHKSSRFHDKAMGDVIFSDNREGPGN